MTFYDTLTRNGRIHDAVFMVNCKLSWKILRQIFYFIWFYHNLVDHWRQLISVFILSGTWFSSDSWWYSFRSPESRDGREERSCRQMCFTHCLFMTCLMSRLKKRKNIVSTWSTIIDRTLTLNADYFFQASKSATFFNQCSKDYPIVIPEWK